MLLRVAVFSSECRTESLHITQPNTLLFYVQLPTASQHCFLCKEVLLPVYHSRFLLYCFDIFHIISKQISDLKQLARALAVRGSDDRSVYLQEPIVVEEFVGGVCK